MKDITNKLNKLKAQQDTCDNKNIENNIEIEISIVK